MRVGDLKQILRGIPDDVTIYHSDLNELVSVTISRDDYTGKLFIHMSDKDGFECE